MIESFESRGLRIHEVEVSRDQVEALGVVLDSRRLLTRLTAKRFWRVHGAIGALCRRRRVTGRQLEVVLGHATFCALLRRETLTVFHTLYPFIRKFRDTPAALWDSCRAELLCFRGLMITLVSPWALPWNEYVLA